MMDWQLEEGKSLGEVLTELDLNGWAVLRHSEAIENRFSVWHIEGVMGQEDY